MNDFSRARAHFPPLAAATAALCLTLNLAAANAQDEPDSEPTFDTSPTPSPAAAPTPAPAPAPVPAPVPAAVETAHQPTSPSLGVGGQLALSGFGGLQILYQTDGYHIDGLISFLDAADTTVTLGGRFFWHTHRSRRADFSLGAGLGLTHINDADLDILHVEAVGQIRFFATPAVAISATMGVALQTLDGDVVGLGSDLLGGAGITYLFY